MSYDQPRSRRTSQPASESERARDPSLASVFTPSTPSEEAPQRTMADRAASTREEPPADNTHSAPEKDTTAAGPPDTTPKKSACKKHAGKGTDANTSRRERRSKKKGRKQTRSDRQDTTSSSASTSASDSSVSSDSVSEDSDSGDSSSTSEAQKKHKQRKGKTRKNQRTGKKARSSRVVSESDSDVDDSEDDISSQDERVVRKLLAKLKARKRAKQVRSEEPSDDQQEADSDADPDEEVTKVSKSKRDGRRKGRGKKAPDDQEKKGTAKSNSKKKTASKVAFKRVDELWDNTIHNYKLSETVDDPDASEWDQYIFTVRRSFDSENRYLETFVDIKSKPLRDALAKVMNGVKGVSLVQETAVVDPNMLFLYLEEARQYRKDLKQAAKTLKKKKARKMSAVKAAHLQVLVRYLDADYAETKKTLYPLLDANMITYDLLWALFKPNTIAYTPTYGNEDEPRAFKIEYSTKETSFMGGQWYSVEGRYLEYDGKSFGMGTIAARVDSFKGVRKINRLACYPLAYHRDPASIKNQLIERGKKFVTLRGMNYRFHKGMAFYKKKRSAAKVNVNSRIMIDPALHRRINPNYPVSNVKNSGLGLVDSEDEDADDEGCCCYPLNFDTDNDGGGNAGAPGIKYRVVQDENGRGQVWRIQLDNSGDAMHKEAKMDEEADPTDRAFSEEELLLASPVVLGFAFSEKLWLEFTISGVSDIEWSEDAFDSLVLPREQKSVVKALVESHTFHAAHNIDDVIQGKGKGLVSVLHGPPGTGKTLTAEGIAELLQRPLYMVSVGELGMDSRTLEAELNKILDIAHSWGAVLLLDEADIFLEKRTIQDIHRNALVSIFLRLLEYFQGILFLTTNRVETFDDAFQSRIHLAIRYGELSPKARRSVWTMFLERVQAKEGVQTARFTNGDFDALARRTLNGRQIKNAVLTAQALAVNEKSALSMEHIKRVLEVAECFEHDLRGGTGYVDAMRSYT